MTAEEILAQCNRYLYQLANKAARQFREDPEDWVQEFRLDVVRFAHTYDPGRGAVTTWIHLRCWRIVSLRKVMGRFAKRATMPWDTLDATDWKHDRADARETDPSDAAEAGEVVDLVRAAVKALSPRDRLLVESLFELNGRPGLRLRELAVKLGVTKSRTQQLAARALERVGERLGDGREGGGEAEIGEGVRCGLEAGRWSLKSSFFESYPLAPHPLRCRTVGR